jgi:signal transduction histidine kinase
MSLSATALISAPRVARRPSVSLLWAIALAGCAAGAFSLIFALTNNAIGPELGEPLIVATLFSWTTVAYILGGVIAWSRRPSSRFGPLMIGTGVACFLVTLSWTSADVSYTVGQALDKVPAVLFLTVFLAFPSGRLNGRFERALVASAFVIAIVLELVRMAIGDYGPHNLLGFAPHPGGFDVVRKVQLLVLSGCCLAGLGILIARRRREGPPLRRSLTVLIDAFGLGLVMIAVFFVANALNAPAVAQIRWALFVTLGLAPVAFLVGLVDARLARSAVGDLLLELRADSSPASLRAALARALRDPSLDLAYWLPEFESWADAEGRSVDLPEPGSGRAVTLIDRDGAHMAALLHDPALDDEPELLAAVGAAAGIALENGRLQAEQKAHLEELKGSRARVIEAGQRERQRLERNLHDGAQQRLIALSLELSLLEKQIAGDPDTRARLDQARQEIAVSLDELRAVARGLHPAVLSGHGLEVALQTIAAGAPVSVRLNVAFADRLPEQIEVAAYYVVSESLANIGKHARAGSASIDVTHVDGVLVVEVVDDGVGGADSEHGSGLRGLADRVEALGGKLRVWSPAGGGTRLRAEVPCA